MEPVKGETWTDEFIEWDINEPHIGRVVINYIDRIYVSYIKVDGYLGVMEREKFLRWFVPLETE